MVPRGTEIRLYVREDIKYYVCRAQSPALLAAAAGLAPAA